MTKKMLATSLLAVCLATTSLASGNAVAKDPELSFYPKQRWTIEQVGTTKAGELQNCAVSNQLNNGYIVQLAGTSNGFTNINIDFRQDSFEVNRKYEVSYSVPGTTTKTMPTKAFKKNLLVSDLRNEKEFSEALRKAGVLDVQIRDTQFRMYLTGLEAAMEQYENCITPQEAMAKAMPKSQEETIAAQDIPQQPREVDGAHAPPPPLNITLITEDESDVQENTEDTAMMPAQALRPKPSNTPRYTEELAQKLKEESKQYQPAAKVAEGEAATESIDASTDMVDTTDALDTIEPEASTATSEETNIEVAMHVQELEITAPTIVEKNITSQRIKSPGPVYNITKHEHVSADFTKEVQQKEAIETANTVMMETAQRLANIESSSGQEQEDFVIMRNKISDLEGRISGLTNKNIMLDEELKISLQDAENERLSVSSENWNLERATLKFNESERQIMRLGRQLQTHRAQCDKEKSGLENMLFDPELTNQQQLASLASLEAELDESKSTLYRQQRQYEERIRLLEEQLNAL